MTTIEARLAALHLAESVLKSRTRTVQGIPMSQEFSSEELVTEAATIADYLFA